MNELSAAVELIKQGGLALIIAILIYGGMKRWFVWGWEYDAMRAEYQTQIAAIGRDRDGWRALADRGTADAKLLIEWALKTSREEKE